MNNTKPFKLNKPQPTRLYTETWKSLGIPSPIPEYNFCMERKWRIDYAWPKILFAVEIEGGIWTRGRHITPKGFLNDIEKYNAMAEKGWLLLRYPPKGIRLTQIKQAIINRYEWIEAMKKLNNTEMLIFLNKRSICPHVFDGKLNFECKIMKTICDMDDCPILKKCENIEQFVKRIEKQ